MTWDRIVQWEITEKPDCVVLTLHGGGSVTPLMVIGWTLEDLETVMLEATASTTGPAVESESVQSGTTATAPVQPRVARRHTVRRSRGGLWKALATTVLLVALAAAVTLVLLQSAGAISWSFLGPVA